MQEILFVAVIQPVQQLLHNAGVIEFIKINHSGFQQAHQIMVHVLKN